jgi:photosystem II stability/assembly factor-like uncharacterized protein
MTWSKGGRARASIRRPRAALSWVATVVALVGLVGVAPARADTGNVLRWQQLGHIGDQPVQWIAVPPDGLASGVLFARIADAHGQNVATRRSRDGGKTWDTVPDPPGRIALAPGGSPVFSLGNDAVYRSTDTGATWTAVVPVQGAELSFSPAFQQDATVFLRGGGSLWRTRTAAAPGRIWTLARDRSSAWRGCRPTSLLTRPSSSAAWAPTTPTAWGC